MKFKLGDKVKITILESFNEDTVRDIKIKTPNGIATIIQIGIEQDYDIGEIYYEMKEFPKWHFKEKWLKLIKVEEKILEQI